MAIRTSTIPNFDLEHQLSGSVIIIDSIVTLPNHGTDNYTDNYTDNDTDNDTDSDTVTLQPNITLIFEGGLIFANNSRTLKGDNTTIVAGRTQIFSPAVSVNGTWNISEAYPEWFGAMSYDTLENSSNGTPSSEAINKAIVMKHAGDVSFANGIYSINAKIIVPCGIRLVGTPGNGLSNESNNNPTGTIFQIDNNFNNTTGHDYIIDINVQVVNNNGTTKLDSIWGTPQPVTTIENIIISNFNENKTCALIPIGIAIGGGANILHVTFNNIPNAVKWVMNDYSDGRKINNCVYFNSIQLTDPDSMPTAFDLGRMGDALDFSYNVIHGDISNNKALIINAAYGATILGNIFNSDVIIKEGKGIVFSGNHINAGAQIQIEFSQISINSNYIERRERPSIEIFGSKYHEASSVDLQNNVFGLRGLKSRFGYNTYPTLEQINEYEHFNEYDIIVEEDSMLTIKNCFRDTMLFGAANFQPTGIIIASSTRVYQENSQFDMIINEIKEFNEDSYMLSYGATILGGKVFNKNFVVPDVNSISVISVGVPTHTEHTWWIGTPGSYKYAYQVIWDKDRRIIGKKGGQSIFEMTNQLLSLGGQDNRGVGIWVGSTSPVPLRLYRKRVGSYAIKSNDYDEYVDIPASGCKILVDNGYDVSGYKWKNINDDTIITPISDSLQKIQKIHEMHKVGVNVVGTALPTEDWTANYALPPLLGWLDGDKLSILGSDTTYIVKAPNNP